MKLLHNHMLPICLGSFFLALCPLFGHITVSDKTSFSVLLTLGVVLLLVGFYNFGFKDGLRARDAGIKLKPEESTPLSSKHPSNFKPLKDSHLDPVIIEQIT